MIVHLFNSSSVSGPERLVLPALATTPVDWMIVNLLETRNLTGDDPLKRLADELKLPYRAVSVRGRWDRQAIRDLAALWEELNPQAVHAHDVKASIFLLHSTSPSHPFPTLSTHHGIHGRPDWKTRIYEWLYRRRYLKSFSRVLCVSTADYRFMKTSGVPEKLIRLHLNGIDGHWVSEAERTERSAGVRRAWFPNEPQREALFVFGVVGRLSREKGHERLFHVLSDLQRLPATGSWVCLVFGRGSLEAPLRRLVSRLGLDGRVKWMGYRPAVAQEIVGLDALLSFSSAEGLPINLLEAGWAATPVAATLVGGVQDLLPDDSYGERISPQETSSTSAQRLAAMMTSDGRERLKQRALNFQQRVSLEFTQARWIERLLALYQELGVVPTRREALT